jgi:hypothetical protein
MQKLPANQMQQKANAAAAQAQKADDAMRAAKERKQQMKENINKMLNQQRQMQPRI